MKNLTKLALALSIAGATATAVATDVELMHGGQSQGVFTFNSMEVDSLGKITVDLLAPLAQVASDNCGANTSWNSTSLQCEGQPTAACGDNTQEVDGVCVGTATLSCGTGTTEQNGECVADVTPPTITSIIPNPASLAEGVSSATVTFQFSRPVTGFSQGDISVSPSTHSVSGFTAVDADTYRVTFNRSGNSDGTATISVAAGTYLGDNGVAGTAGSKSITLVGEQVQVGDCTVPSNVELTVPSAVSSFGGETGVMEFKLPKSEIYSYGFNTPSAVVGGQVDLGGLSWTSNMVRRMWISDCPGGSKLSKSCYSEGNLQTMRYVTAASRVSCVLDQNATYYFNVAHSASGSGCTSSNGCEATLMHKGGWK